MPVRAIFRQTRFWDSGSDNIVWGASGTIQKSFCWRLRPKWNTAFRGCFGPSQGDPCIRQGDAIHRGAGWNPEYGGRSDRQSFRFPDIAGLVRLGNLFAFLSSPATPPYPGYDLRELLEGADYEIRLQQFLKNLTSVEFKGSSGFGSTSRSYFLAGIAKKLESLERRMYPSLSKRTLTRLGGASCDPISRLQGKGIWAEKAPK